MTSQPRIGRGARMARGHHHPNRGMVSLKPESSHERRNRHSVDSRAAPPVRRSQRRDISAQQEGQQWKKGSQASVDVHSTLNEKPPASVRVVIARAPSLSPPPRTQSSESDYT